MARLVVIGGNPGGMAAASQARRLLPPEDLAIAVFERSSWVSYSSCGEPYYVAGDVEDLDDLVARTPEEFAARSIEVYLHHEAIAIDTGARTVTVRDLDRGTERVEPYDVLLYAAGAATNRPPIAGLDLEGVYEMRTLDDADAVRRAVDAGGVGRAVVVGGGYIGLEMAESFHRLDIETTVVSALPSVLMPQFDIEMADLVLAHAREAGITVETDRRIQCIEGERGRVVRVGCGDVTYEADLVLLALGSNPEIELAAAAGIPLGPTGAIAVDDRQATPIEGVWASGDCCEQRHRVSGRPSNIHLGTIANKQGRIAGFQIARSLGAEAPDLRFPGVLGTAITRLCDLEIARTGLTEAEAADLALDYVAHTFESRTAASYWPEREGLQMKVLAERGSRRLLGAQIVGGRGAGKRIDVFAMALWNGMTADDLVNVDLSYAPPFSGVWDAVLIAGRHLQAALDGREE